MKSITEKQLLKLRPEFKLANGARIIDWFEVTKGETFFCIRSGLRHADGKTKSPFFYEDVVVDKNKSKKIALDKFTKWYDSKKNENNESQKQKKIIQRTILRLK